MGVKVRLHPRELTDKAETLHYANGVSWSIWPDHTLEVYDEDEQVIAHVHADRWDSVNQTAPAKT